ncbi:hypothetical protein [uncultured Zoogloea sp.]|uniref:hypothetical protein n=1 Tax=uncultured Zoogloea sp. TaxID=160237 RepID=UPI002601B275|nr:hypothetical protein [uncultured Zoogloea sp.]
MAQATRPIPFPMLQQMVQLEGNTLAAGVLVPFGTLAVNDAGKIKPLTDTLMQAGAAALGVSLDTQDVRTEVADVTRRCLFARGTQWTAPAAKSGDVPTATEIGKFIAVQDNQTVKKTITGTDLQVRLDAITSDGYVVFIP